MKEKGHNGGRLHTVVEMLPKFDVYYILNMINWTCVLQKI